MAGQGAVRCAAAARRRICPREGLAPRGELIKWVRTGSQRGHWVRNDGASWATLPPTLGQSAARTALAGKAELDWRCGSPYKGSLYSLGHAGN